MKLKNNMPKCFQYFNIKSGNSKNLNMSNSIFHNDLLYNPKPKIVFTKIKTVPAENDLLITMLQN